MNTHSYARSQPAFHMSDNIIKFFTSSSSFSTKDNFFFLPPSYLRAANSKEGKVDGSYLCYMAVSKRWPVGRAETLSGAWGDFIKNTEFSISKLMIGINAHFYVIIILLSIVNIPFSEVMTSHCLHKHSKVGFMDEISAPHRYNCML